MAGILGIYGLIVSIILCQYISKDISFFNSYQILGAGLICGFSCLASGLAIGISGDAGVRAYAQQEKIFSGLLMIMIFAEVIGIYGFIIALVMLFFGSSKESS